MNTTTHHTPGPWSADKWATGYTVSAPESHYSVCRFEGCNNAEANAALIAAAPDILAALKSAVELLANLGNEIQENIGEADYNPQSIPSVRNAALTAIAKAEGRAE